MTSIIDGRLIQQGGGFMFNDKLFDEYQGDASCTKFKDIHGNVFDSITIYHVVEYKYLYISTDKGLFRCNTDTGEVTALSYELDDIVFMQLMYHTNDSKTVMLTGFYHRMKDMEFEK